MNNKNSDTIIQFHNVTVNFGTYNALDKVSLSIKKGDLIYLIGISGAGKTTILRSIYFDVMPSKGRIIIGDYDSFLLKKRQIPYLRRKIGVVFQDFKLFEDRNVFENIAFTLKVIGAKKKEVKQKVLKVLAEVGLSHKRNCMPLELSGGEQQRTVIARAIVNDPLILLADEPTGNLDPDTSLEILNILKKIHTKGTAVMIATHNYSLMKHFPGKVIKIDKGRILED